MLADGQNVVKRYNEPYKKANQARDAKQSELTRVTPTLAQTRAGTRYDRKPDADGKTKVEPEDLHDCRLARCKSRRIRCASWSTPGS